MLFHCRYTGIGFMCGVKNMKYYEGEELYYACIHYCMSFFHLRTEENNRYCRMIDGLYSIMDEDDRRIEYQKEHVKHDLLRLKEIMDKIDWDNIK